MSAPRHARLATLLVLALALAAPPRQRSRYTNPNGYMAVFILCTFMELPDGRIWDVCRRWGKG